MGVEGVYIVSGVVIAAIVAGFAGYGLHNLSTADTASKQNTNNQETVESTTIMSSDRETNGKVKKEVSQPPESVDKLIARLDNSDRFIRIEVLPDEETGYIDYIGFPTFYTQIEDDIFAITISNVEISRDFFSTREYVSGKEELIEEELLFIDSEPAKEEILSKLPHAIPYENGTIYGFGGDPDAPAPSFGDIFSLSDVGNISRERLEAGYHIGNNIFGKKDNNLIFIRRVVNTEVFLSGSGYTLLDDSQYNPEKVSMMLDLFL